VQRPYTTNGLNQYSNAGSVGFTYDANGNLISDGSTTYVYDVENRLVSAAGAHNAALRYDPLGRLYEISGGALTLRQLYDGDALVDEYGTEGILHHRYVHGSNAGADDPLVWYGYATMFWLHPDRQGSIFAIADPSGQLAAINRYDEYGIPQLSSTGENLNTGRFQYTGQIWLPELGMYHYKARIYSPTLGRFLQTDPIGYRDQSNLYAYVGDDPVNLTDPTGAARVCTTSSSSRIPACVNVDGNLNGVQNIRLQATFHDFILRHSGADLSRSGAEINSITGSVTSHQVTMISVVSQFVGYDVRGWGNSKIAIDGNMSSDTAGDTTRVGSGSSAYFQHRINPNFMDQTWNPSWLARTMFHEYGHKLEWRMYGYMSHFNSDPMHIGLDQWARSRLRESGLGAGGCPAIGGALWGIFSPDFPGC
jgi:RHS repeat-associated protein